MSLIDDFENSFQACLAPFTNPISSHVFDSDELKANADNIQRFLEISRQIESSFIQKRALLADQKPELILTEEINDLKIEINRKDMVLNKYYDKLNKWTSIVNEATSGGKQLPNIQPNQMTGMVPMRMNHPANINALNQKKAGQSPGINSPIMHAPGPMMNTLRSKNPTIPPNHPIGTQQIPFNPQNPNHGGLQGPLAYLERTTCNIGMTDNRR